ncbi:MAG TPA: mannose-1-phosphate guanylyltransferase [Candidatus Eisenbacteria bacterium]
MCIVPVILAGGRGERFWPLSRRHRPKQLLPLLSDRSMLADTLARLEGSASPRDAWVITARDLHGAVREAVPHVPHAHVVGEPVGKNTAPAIALACWWIRHAGPDVAVVVLPSDHRIEPAERFREELERAARLALERRVIVTFGIPPTRPETGYGYVEVGDALAGAPEFHAVAAFREKPDHDTAARYLADGKHLWNAGMFVFAPDVMLEELAAHAPEIAALLPMLPDRPGEGSEEALEKFYAAAPSISIDYAVMERSRRAVVARAGFAWDDLGSWAALATPDAVDAEGNVARGPVILHESRGIVAFADGGLLATIGVENLIVVRTGDVTLVCSRDRAQDVRAIVERLKRGEAGRDGFL